MLVNALLELGCLVRESNQLVEICCDVPLAMGTAGNFKLHLLAVLDEFSVCVISLLSSFSHFKDLRKEFLVLKGQLPHLLVDLLLLVSQVIVCAVHTVVGLSVALGFHLTVERGFHPCSAVAQPSSIICLYVCDIRRPGEHSLRRPWTPI